MDDWAHLCGPEAPSSAVWPQGRGLGGREGTPVRPDLKEEEPIEKGTRGKERCLCRRTPPQNPLLKTARPVQITMGIAGCD